MKVLTVVLGSLPEPPEWIRLLPRGEVKLTDGREPFVVDEESLARIVEDFRSRGVDLVVDYEHQSLNNVRAPAAGWIKELEAREDGLWARVEWTAPARTYLENREYRYYSPVLKLDPETRRAVSLLHVALTNTPAIAHLPPLVAQRDLGEVLWAAVSDRDEAREAQRARSRRYGIGVKEGGNVTKPGKWANVPDEQWGDPVNYRYPMPDAAHARNALARWGDPDNRRQYSEAEQKIITNRIRRRAKALGIQTRDEKEASKAMLDKLKDLVGAQPEVTEEELLTLVDQRLRAAGELAELRAVLDLPGEAGVSEIKGAVLALKQGADRLQKVEEELTALQAERAREKAEKAVEAAMSAGKLMPSQKDWALEYARKDLPGFEAYVSKAPRIVPVGEQLKIVDKTPEGGLDQAALEVCKQMGLAPETFQAERERQLKGE
ncbi:MAG: hypothetical protein JRI59_05605 [Deltaproteobacteria bacterium]|nr:hypothetical protein [Deltaproteobacteria bacterium]